MSKGAKSKRKDPPARRSVTRAKPPPREVVHPPKPAMREERVRYIMELMTKRIWVTGETGDEIAREWRMHSDTVGRDAAEASRRVRAVGDRDFVMSRLQAALDDALDAARGRPRDTAEVAKAYASVMGIGSTKVEHTGAGGLPLTLPPVLAMLEPPPTVEEVERFVATGEVPKRLAAPPGVEPGPAS